MSCVAQHVHEVTCLRSIVTRSATSRSTSEIYGVLFVGEWWRKSRAPRPAFAPKCERGAGPAARTHGVPSPSGSDPLLDLVHGLALDASVTVIGEGLAVVACGRAAVHFDQGSAVLPVGGYAIRRLGHLTGVLLVQHDQVEALQSSRIEACDGMHTALVLHSRT